MLPSLSDKKPFSTALIDSSKKGELEYVSYEKALAKIKQEREILKKFEEKYNNAKKTIKKKTGIEVSSAYDIAGVMSHYNTVTEVSRFLKQIYINE